MAADATLQVDNRPVKVSNLHKVFYPGDGFTKGELIQYYVRIAPYLLPHLAAHPVSMKRYPDGVRGEAFFEKRCPVYRPSWMATAERPSRSDRGPVNYCVVESLPGLVWVANLASIEFHTLLSTRDDPSRPTFMVFDLDPGPGAGILDCAWVAQELAHLLSNARLESFVKTSGSKGLHVCVPLNTEVTFEQTKRAARGLAEKLAGKHPTWVTANMSRAVRQDKVFIDWSQNDEHKTTVCVYSLRATEHPSVSTPVTWTELRQAQRRHRPSALSFGPSEVLKRVQRAHDLFAPMLTMRQTLAGLRR
jgi:bifunctional non-homologous end joining protein LigD